MPRTEGIIEPQNMSIEEVIDTLSRYDSRHRVKNIRKKLLKIGLEKIAKIQNISKNELNQAKKLQRKSIDDCKRLLDWEELRTLKN